MATQIIEKLRLGQNSLWLETKILPAFLVQCRWFAGKSRTLQSIHIFDHSVAPNDQEWVLLFLEVQYVDGASETYLLPLAYAGVPLADAGSKSAADSSVEYVRAKVPGAILFDSPSDGLIYEAIHHPGFRAEMMQIIATQGQLLGQNGVLRGYAMPSHFEKGASVNFAASHVLKAEQSNTSLIYPAGYFLKLLRRVQVEENPELEILRFLESETQFRQAPRLIGWLEYSTGKNQGTTMISTSTSISISISISISSSSSNSEPIMTSGSTFTLGIAEGLIAFESDAWNHALKMARGYLDYLDHLDHFDSERKGVETEFARLLGQRTAEMHLALASNTSQPEFKPEPFTWEYQKSLAEGIQKHFAGVFKNLERVLPRLEGEAKILAQKVWDKQAKVQETLAPLNQELFATVKFRIHGDYHLGQVLYTGNDIVILDFEGEPSRSLQFRKQKRSPWCDVAGMLRSFHYAIHSVNLDRGVNTKMNPEVRFGVDGTHSEYDIWIELWPEKMAATFIAAYLEAAGSAPFVLPEKQQQALIRLYLMEKAIYELDYELNNRPTWVQIPLLGILRLLEN